VAKLSCLNIEFGDPVRGALFEDRSTGTGVLVVGNINEPNGELDDDGEIDVGSFAFGFGFDIRLLSLSLFLLKSPSLFSKAFWLAVNPSYGYSDNPDLLGT
jgi:hypothetical protein